MINKDKRLMEIVIFYPYRKKEKANHLYNLGG